MNIGGYQGLSRSAVIALSYAADVITKEHKLKAGDTALFWHLVSVVASHIAEDKCDNSTQQ